MPPPGSENTIAATPGGPLHLCHTHSMAGKLYLVATPIGNLEEITYRAVRVLREADVIACEDTRQTRKLLDRYEISKATVSYHEHNEAERAVELASRMAALAASGLPTDSFYFGGFLPSKPGQRAKALEARAEEHATLIFYEAPHRILEALEAVEQTLGPRPVVVARELTKIHEEFLRGTAEEVRAQRAARDSVRGEITLLIGRAAGPAPDDTPVEEAVAVLVEAGTARMDAIKQVARKRGLSKREVYDRLLREK